VCKRPGAIRMAWAADMGPEHGHVEARAPACLHYEKANNCHDRECVAPIKCVTSKSILIRYAAFPTGWVMGERPLWVMGGRPRELWEANPVSIRRQALWVIRDRQQVSRGAPWLTWVSFERQALWLTYGRHPLWAKHGETVPVSIGCRPQPSHTRYPCERQDQKITRHRPCKLCEICMFLVGDRLCKLQYEDQPCELLRSDPAN
jgi:hypothetical protein